MTTTIEKLKAAKAGEWIEHDGKSMPVDRGTLVTAKYASGFERTDRAGTMHSSDEEMSDWRWTDPDDELNIVSYRVLSISKAISSAEEKQGAAS